MNKLIVIFLLFFCSHACFAQDSTKAMDSTKAKVYFNEFGFDMTAFLRQFTNSNSGTYPSYYYPLYYLTYRRHLDCGNIRFAIGGDFSSEERGSSVSTDTNKYKNERFSLETRIGWEFVSELSSRWQAFYGLDFKASLHYQLTEDQFYSGGYAHGNESEVQTYSLAPMLGLRFKINKRLSLSTETSLAINWQKSKSRSFTTPISGQYPPQEDKISPTEKRTYTNFEYPLALFLTFDL